MGITATPSAAARIRELVAELDAAVEGLKTVTMEATRLREQRDAAVEERDEIAEEYEAAETEREQERVRATEAETERDRYKTALDYLADPQSWGGNPHDQTTPLYGHDTPFELAVAALSPED